MSVQFNSMGRRINGLTKPFEVKIGVNGEEPIVVLARRPDPRLLMYEGLLPLPIMKRANELMATWANRVPDMDEGKQKEEGPIALDVLNRMFCLAMVMPRAVLTAADVALAEGESAEDVVIAEDADTAFKEAVLVAAVNHDPKAAARKAEQEAASRFPDEGSGAGGGPDVPGLQPATLGSHGD